MTRLCVITARGGSKRIPRKNVKRFMGKPMLAYAIEASVKSGLFDEVMVSTDDGEIAETARGFGAVVPFMRSEATSNDFATTRDVLYEVLSDYRRNGRGFDEFACVYPCVPFLTPEILVSAHAKFANSNADCLMPVVKFSFPIQRAMRVGEAGFLEYREPESASKRSQDLEAMYHDVGMFYFYKTDAFMAGGDMTIMPYIMPEERIQDIDTMDDWHLAEMKYKLLNEDEPESFH